MSSPRPPSIPDAVVRQVTERLQKIARKQYGDVCRELLFHTRGRSLYIEANRVGEEGEAPVRLCRLEWLGDPKKWAFWFFRYSTMRYERNVTWNGAWTGTPEDCFSAAGYAYLHVYRAGLETGGIIRPGFIPSETYGRVD
ncbi:MAG: hypothetical protein ACRECR_01385 [Thermoplasmata archaeon]